MVVIAYNYKSQIIGIVNADSEKLAYVFWSGRGIVPHHTKVLEKNFMPLSEHPYGVYPILETEEVDVYTLKRDEKILIIKS